MVFRAMKWDEVIHLVITNSKENRAKELTLGNLSSLNYVVRKKILK